MQSTTMMSPLGELVLVAEADGLPEVRLPRLESSAAGGGADGASSGRRPPSRLGWAPDADAASEWAPDADAPSGRKAARWRLRPTAPGARRSAHAVLAAARRQLAEYFAGRRCAFELPLKVTGTEFERSVWEALGTVAYGETVTYGRLASHRPTPRGPRGGRCSRPQPARHRRTVPSGGRRRWPARGLCGRPRAQTLPARLRESLGPRGGAVGALSASRVR